MPRWLLVDESQPLYPVGASLVILAILTRAFFFSRPPAANARPPAETWQVGYIFPPYARQGGCGGLDGSIRQASEVDAVGTIKLFRLVISTSNQNRQWSGGVGVSFWVSSLRWAAFQTTKKKPPLRAACLTGKFPKLCSIFDHLQMQ